MTGYRTSLAIAAFALLAVVTAAQDKPPVIRPEDEPPIATQDAPDKPPAPAPGTATGAPTPLGGGTTGNSAPGTAPADDQPDSTPSDFKPGVLGKPQGAITQSDLSGVVDGPPTGTLDEAHGGLGPSMWVNSDRADVEDLLSRIPFVSADPFVRSLSRRVLLTPSEAPVGGARRALITIRIEMLLRGGLVDEAGTLAASLHLGNDPDFVRVQAEALLYAGREKDVCGDLTETRLTAPEPFWLELRTWCFAAGGDTASAELTHAVLDAQNARDPAFDVLAADVLNGRKTMPAGIEHPSALHIYLLRKAGLPVTSAVASKLGTAANLMAARDPRNKPADRLAAATRISATGALSSADMLALLAAQEITPAQVKAATTLLGKLPYLNAQSILRRVATLETRPPDRAALLSNAITLFPDRWTQTALLQGDLVATVKPDAAPSLQFAFSRILILSGRTDAASAWYAGAAEGTDLQAFRILADLAAPNAQRDAAASLAYAWFAVNAQPQKNPGPLAALALGLNDVLHRPMPPAARSLGATLEGMRWPGRRPAQGDIQKLLAAAAQPGRKGEVALRVLDIVGANGPRDLPADVVIECVRVLNQVGLTAEARALAVEALAQQTP